MRFTAREISNQLIEVKNSYIFYNIADSLFEKDFEKLLSTSIRDPYNKQISKEVFDIYMETNKCLLSNQNPDHLRISVKKNSIASYTTIYYKNEFLFEKINSKDGYLPQVYIDLISKYNYLVVSDEDIKSHKKLMNRNKSLIELGIVT